MRKKIAATVLIAISAYCATINAQTKLESTPQVRQKTFEKIWRTVDEKYFDPAHGGVDWRSVHERYAPKMGQVKTDREFYDLMNQMLGEIDTSHLEIITPDVLEKLKEPAATTGIGMREINGQVVITRLMDNSSATRANLKTGFVIARINGEAVKDLNDAKRKISGKPNTAVKISYLDGSDNEHEVTLDRLELDKNDRGDLGGGLHLYALFSSRRIGSDIGYLTFTNFMEFLNPRIAAAMESFRDTKGIVIDLRGNGGGDDSVGIKMANMLFERETQLMITKTRKGDDLYYKAKGNKNAYKGKVVILIDQHSGSASEQFTAGMQEAGRAFVIGKRSEGADLDAGTVELPTGAVFIFPYGQPRTPKGFIVEGQGVKPDIEIDLIRQDLLAGKDTHIEAAVLYINSKK
jgi:C-terminal peptidase prc